MLCHWQKHLEGLTGTGEKSLASGTFGKNLKGGQCWNTGWCNNIRNWWHRRIFGRKQHNGKKWRINRNTQIIF